MDNKLIFPNLTEKDIEIRVQSVKKTEHGIGAILLLYKDARVDMKLLDETVGAYNWQRSHSVVNGNLFCSVSIKNTDGQWVTKEDVGTESNTEREKGQASDAFKRACFNWGIGRELYTAPFIWVSLDKSETYESKGKTTTNAKFYVSKVVVSDDKRITDLVIVDKLDKTRFYMKSQSVKVANTKPFAETELPVEQLKKQDKDLSKMGKPALKGLLNSPSMAQYHEEAKARLRELGEAV